MQPDDLLDTYDAALTAEQRVEIRKLRTTAAFTLRHDPRDPAAALLETMQATADAFCAADRLLPRPILHNVHGGWTLRNLLGIHADAPTIPEIIVEWCDTVAACYPDAFAPARQEAAE